MVPHCQTRSRQCAARTRSWAVERAFPGLQLPRQPFWSRASASAFSALSRGVVADALRGTRRQLDQHLGEAEVAIDLEQQIDEGRHLVEIWSSLQKDVGVVLHEVAHGASGRATCPRVVPVARPELGQAQRQVAVALQPVVVDLDVAGQFIGLIAKSRFSELVVNMFSRNLSQWPERSQSCGR